MVRLPFRDAWRHCQRRPTARRRVVFRDAARPLRRKGQGSGWRTKAPRCGVFSKSARSSKKAAAFPGGHLASRTWLHQHSINSDKKTVAHRAQLVNSGLCSWLMSLEMKGERRSPRHRLKVALARPKIAHRHPEHTIRSHSASPSPLTEAQPKDLLPAGNLRIRRSDLCFLKSRKGPAGKYRRLLHAKRSFRGACWLERVGMLNDAERWTESIHGRRQRTSFSRRTFRGSSMSIGSIEVDRLVWPRGVENPTLPSGSPAGTPK